MSGGLLFIYLRNYFLLAIALLFNLPCICQGDKGEPASMWSEELSRINEKIFEEYQKIKQLNSVRATSSKIELAKLKCVKSYLEAQDAELDRFAKYLDEEKVRKLQLMGLSYMNKIKSIKFVDDKNCPLLEEEESTTPMKITTGRIAGKYITFEYKHDSSITENHDECIKKYVAAQDAKIGIIIQNKNGKIQQAEAARIERKSHKMITSYVKKLETFKFVDPKNCPTPDEEESSWIAITLLLLLLGSLLVYLSCCYDSVAKNNFSSRTTWKNTELEPKKRTYSGRKHINSGSNRNKNSDLNTISTQFNENNSSETASSSDDLQNNLASSSNNNNLKTRKRRNRNRNLRTENNNISDDLQSNTTSIPESKPENLNMQQQTACSSIKLPTVNSSSVKLEQKLEKILECPICLEQFKNPKMLPCQHSFCMEDCMEKLPRNKHGKQLHIICPICRKENFIPKNGFPINYLLQSLLDIQNKN